MIFNLGNLVIFSHIRSLSLAVMVSSVVGVPALLSVFVASGIQLPFVFIYHHTTHIIIICFVTCIYFTIFGHSFDILLSF